MTVVRTEEWMFVDWYTEGIGTEELPGVTMFAHWTREGVQEPLLSLSGWPPQTRARAHVYFDQEDRWTVWVWDFQVSALPSKERWQETLRAVMRQAIDAGALLAYCGWDWDDPRFFFDSVRGPPPIYAAMTCDGDFVCASQLGEPVQLIDCAFLAKLHKLVTDSLPPKAS